MAVITGESLFCTTSVPNAVSIPREMISTEGFFFVFSCAIHMTLSEHRCGKTKAWGTIYILQETVGHAITGKKKHSQHTDDGIKMINNNKSPSIDCLTWCVHCAHKLPVVYNIHMDAQHWFNIM